MQPQTQTPIQTLIENLFRHPQDPHIRSELQARRQEVAGMLEDPAAWSALSVGDEWDTENAQAVYDALADVVGESEPLPQTNPLWEAYSEDRAGIGHAFQEILVPGLPNGIDFVKTHISHLPRVSSRFQATLRKDPDVIAGGADADQLVPFGVTPLALFRTTSGIGDVLDRAMDRNLISPSVMYTLSQARGLSLHERDVVATEYFIREIAGVCASTDDFAKACFSWAVAAAGHIPRLLDGYETRLTASGVSLEAAPSRERNLFRRWAPAWTTVARA